MIGVPLTDEEELLAGTVARLVADHPVVPPRPGTRLGEDAALRAALVGAGLWAMRAPTGLGGAGATVLETALVAEELGRGPAPVPWLGVQLATELLACTTADVGSPVDDLLRTLAEGAAGGVVLDDDLRAPASAGVAFDAADGAVLVGVDGGRVEQAEAGPDLDGVDLTRRAVEALPVGGAPALGVLDDGGRRRWEAVALVLVCAELVGTMHAALAAAVAHAAERVQFGQPVASFQAVQHLCADQLVTIEAARSATRHAARSIDAAESWAALDAARIAKAWCAEAGRDVTEAAIQVWGGLGMTWECSAHLYLRRALLDRALLGDEHHQLEALAETSSWSFAAPASAPDVGAPPGPGAPPDPERFRAALRSWLAEHTPSGPAPQLGAERAAYWGDWHRALHEGGWMGLSWPVEYGGRGLPAAYEAICNDEIGLAGAPPMPHVGFLGRALLHVGTEEQKRRFLPSLLSGAEVWCQGFSEPDAGSDLAALRTRAVRDGEHWVVDGQKVWTSDAAWADWCLLLVRTDPEVAKHRGISALLVAMSSPGIEVRPITQINGDTEFNEVFLTGVRVPADQVLGAPGDGWGIAMTTVAYERGPADVGFSSRYARLMGELEARTAITEPGVLGRIELARARVHVEVLRAHVARSLASRGDVAPGAEGSIDKLLGARTEQCLHHVALDLHAGDALTGRRPDVLAEYLYSRAATIAGGTSQIQRTIIAERLLGMPRST